MLRERTVLRRLAAIHEDGAAPMPSLMDTLLRVLYWILCADVLLLLTDLLYNDYHPDAPLLSPTVAVTAFWAFFGGMLLGGYLDKLRQQRKHR